MPLLAARASPATDKRFLDPEFAVLYIRTTCHFRMVAAPFTISPRATSDGDGDEHVVEFYHPSLHRGQATGLVQTFRLKRIKTGFGIRHVFICGCKRPVINLYYRHRNLACRRCCNAIYASQTLDQRSRPILQASRIPVRDIGKTEKLRCRKIGFL
jgi:hypothetical protein